MEAIDFIALLKAKFISTGLLPEDMEDEDFTVEPYKSMLTMFTPMVEPLTLEEVTEMLDSFDVALLIPLLPPSD